jgi:hypothetical protein
MMCNKWCSNIPNNSLIIYFDICSGRWLLNTNVEVNQKGKKGPETLIICRYLLEEKKNLLFRIQRGEYK